MAAPGPFTRACCRKQEQVHVGDVHVVGQRARAEAFGNIIMAAAVTGGAVGASVAMLKGQ